MQRLTVLAFICLYFSCALPKKSFLAINFLNGTWVPVQQQMSGKDLPKAIFEKQNLILNDSNYTFSAESVDKGIVKYKNGKMDIYRKEGVNAGKHFTAIYQLENGQLFICYDLSGKSYPTSFETTSAPLFFFLFTKKTPRSK